MSDGDGGAGPLSLGTWPTPLEPAPRLAAAIGLDRLWLRRDGGLPSLFAHPGI